MRRKDRLPLRTAGTHPIQPFKLCPAQDKCRAKDQPLEPNTLSRAALVPDIPKFILG